jgi:hypothetical protein
MMKMILALLFQSVIPMYLGLGASPTSGAFKTLANADSTAAGQFGGQAGAEGAQLNPFFSQEMRAQHGFTPGQTNELLTSAEGGAGGAFGGAEGVMDANAARTGNATTLTKSLDEMARDKAKVAAGASEGIAAQDVTGAKMLNQEGAAGMQGLYGTNVKGQLDAMGQQNQALKDETAAIGPGFLQKTIGDISELAKGAKNGPMSYV